MSDANIEQGETGGFDPVPAGPTEGPTITDVPAAAGPRGLPRATGAIKTRTLSNGAVAVVRDGCGHDLEKAATAAAGYGGVGLAMALVAQLTTVDGEPVLFEEVLVTRIEDVGVLIEAAMGNGLSSVLGISSA